MNFLSFTSTDWPGKPVWTRAIPPGAITRLLAADLSMLKKRRSLVWTGGKVPAQKPAGLRGLTTDFMRKLQNRGADLYFRGRQAAGKAQ